jgi:hypothetical protein
MLRVRHDGLLGCSFGRGGVEREGLFHHVRELLHAERILLSDLRSNGLGERFARAIAGRGGHAQRHVAATTPLSDGRVEVRVLGALRREGRELQRVQTAGSDECACERDGRYHDILTRRSRRLELSCEELHGQLDVAALIVGRLVDDGTEQRGVVVHRAARVLVRQLLEPLGRTVHLRLVLAEGSLLRNGAQGDWTHDEQRRSEDGEQRPSAHRFATRRPRRWPRSGARPRHLRQDACRCRAR